MATVNLGRVKPIHRGAYSGTMTYRPLDIVTYSETTYFCIQESLGNTPGNTTYFQSIIDASEVKARANHTGTQPLSTISDAGTAASKDAVSSAADNTPSRLVTNARIDIWVRDKERQALEAATNGACTIERTTNGQACHMFVLPKMTWEDLLPGQELGIGTHEAFIESGVEKSELLVGMYQAATLNSELVSQPGLVPRRSIDWDQSNSEAQAAGFNLFGNWEWSAIAFWCMANGFQPRGNTDYGRSHSHPHEQGINVEYDNVETGSGPNGWSHNNAANGIADLVGNVWEWQWGFKMVDGRIFLAPDNDRSLVESSWVDTLWDMPASGTWATQNSTGAPESVLRSLVMPNGIADPQGYLYTNLTGERFPVRGGSRSDAGHAGLGALSLNGARTYSVTSVGLRLSRLV